MLPLPITLADKRSVTLLDLTGCRFRLPDDRKDTPVIQKGIQSDYDKHTFKIGSDPRSAFLNFCLYFSLRYRHIVLNAITNLLKDRFEHFFHTHEMHGVGIIQVSTPIFCIQLEPLSISTYVVLMRCDISDIEGDTGV